MHVEIVDLEDTYFVKSQKGKFSEKSEIFGKLNVSKSFKSNQVENAFPP